MKAFHLYDTSTGVNEDFNKRDLNRSWVSYERDTKTVRYARNLHIDTNGYEFVNMGFPSGTLWATCDIGSSSPEKTGYKFAWGEIIDKTTFSWNNYKYGTAASDSSMTKYNSRDKLTTLELEDDAAHVNMGGSWRMPTADEADEFLQYTTKKITDTTTDKRVVFTSKINGNTITFPLGFDIWTSTRYATNSFSYDANALKMDYDSNTWGIGVSSMISRYQGFCIRGVCSIPIKN